MRDFTRVPVARAPWQKRSLTTSPLRARNRAAFRSTRDPQLFYIHSRWKDEAAFENHAGLPHTLRFLERVQPLIDHPLDVTRAVQIG